MSAQNLTQLELPGMEVPENKIPGLLDKLLEQHLNQEKAMRPLKRKPVNKRSSAAKFRRQTRKVKAANAPMRGGYRF